MCVRGWGKTGGGWGVSSGVFLTDPSNKSTSHIQGTPARETTGQMTRAQMDHTLFVLPRIMMQHRYTPVSMDAVVSTNPLG